jgi:SCY1-like protein 1
MAPEISKTGWEVIKQNPTHAVDAYNFGVLIFECFNGSYNSSDQLAQMKSIPPSMHQSYKRLLNPNPKSRMSVSQFLDQGKRLGGFFQTPLIQVTEDIDNLGLKAEDERNELLGFVNAPMRLSTHTDLSTGSLIRWPTTSRPTSSK